MRVLGVVSLMSLAGAGLWLAGWLQVERKQGAIAIGIGRAEAWRSITIDTRAGLVADAALVGLVLVTVALVAGSHWVPGTDVLLPTMLAGALATLLLAKVCPRGTTYWLAVELSAVVALFIFTGHHEGGLQGDFAAWVGSIRGSAKLATLITMAGSGWLVTAWSAFWVARRRNAAMALAPLAVTLAVEVLNDPVQAAGGQLVVLWIGLAGTLLLRLNTARIRERWHDRADHQVSVYIASRGAAAGVLLLVVAAMLPPLSTVDLSVGMFHGRSPQGTAGPSAENPDRGGDSQREGNLTHTGYAETVAPGGTLSRSATPVLRVSSDFGRPVYWRGINLYSIVNSAWAPGPARNVTAAAASNAPLEGGSSLARQHVHAAVEVLDAPQRTLFWPGEPFSVDEPSVLQGARPDRLSGVTSVEAAYSRFPLAVGSRYTVDALQSVATEAQLRSAGSDYPPSIIELTGNTTGLGADVRELAQQVAGSAGTPYDRVKSLESYLRKQEKYQLTVDAPPAGTNPISFFLFRSHVGYCEYFASAMGEMVRSLGIPVRLVSGYGPGQGEPAAESDRTFRRESAAGGVVNILRASDAHTWVEVYFPGYGWIPFEPTPDANYPVLSRGTSTAPTAAPVAPAAPPVVAPPARVTSPHGTSGVRLPLAGGLTLVAILAAAAGLLLGLRRILVGPVEAPAASFAWARLRFLGRRLGLFPRSSETPLDYGSRLAGRLPGMGPEIMTIAVGYSRDLYGADARRAPSAAESEAWAVVRRGLARLILLGDRAGGVRGGERAPRS
ncbi:MAG: transglutaminaseTgpA domain-containing protein [Candidatus Dormibacteria bacterium]